MSRRSLPRIDPTDLREHADAERIERVWQRLEAALPSGEARGPRRLGWLAVAAVAATFVAFGGGVVVGRSVSSGRAEVAAIVGPDRGTETDVWAAGEQARSFALPGGGQLKLKPGSTVEVQRAGGGVTLKLVQGDAELETPAAGSAQPTVVVGDARLDAQASSTVQISRHLDNLEVGVSRGSAVVDSPSLKKSIESGENVSVPLHRASVTASNTAVASTPRHAHHADAVAADASGAPAVAPSAPVAVSEWQKLSNDGHFPEAAQALRTQYGGFDQAVRQANTVQTLLDIRDLAQKSKEQLAAEGAIRRIVTDFPKDANAEIYAPALCERLHGTPDGDKACEIAKKSPLFDADGMACREMRGQRLAGNKTEASRLAKEYVKDHADGRCRDEAQRIINGSSAADDDDDDAPVKGGDAGAAKPGDAKAAPKP